MKLEDLLIQDQIVVDADKVRMLLNENQALENQLASQDQTNRNLIDNILKKDNLFLEFMKSRNIALGELVLFADSKGQIISDTPVPGSNNRYLSLTDKK